MKAHIFRLVPLALAAALAACDGAPPESAATKRATRPHLVETAVATNTQMAASLERIGSLRALREVRLAFREEGRLVELPHHQGDHVAAGALLARLDDALLSAELRKAQAQQAQAGAELARLERLHREQMVTEEALVRARTTAEVTAAEAELLRTRLGFTRISAPFAGVISARLAEPGDIVPRLGHVLTLTDLRSLVTEVAISELLLPQLRSGDKVDVRIDALGQAAHPGRIVRVHPQVDANTRQGLIEIVLNPAPSGARPGQLARLTIKGQSAQRLTVPFAALQRDATGEFVYRVAEGKAVRTAVSSGLHLDDRVEILSGLEEGASVVVRGFLNLKDRRAVKVVVPGAAS